MKFQFPKLMCCQGLSVQQVKPAMSYLIDDRAPLPEAPSNNIHTRGQQEETDHTY